MSGMPKEVTLDSTFAWRRDPYRFISQRCRQWGHDVFETRLLLHRTICMSGPHVVSLFYDTEHFRRAGAAPVRFQRTLFGERGVQTLDGEAHRHRKSMMMSLMTPDRIAELREACSTWWDIYARAWTGRGPVALYDESREILCRGVCAWAGVRVDESQVERRTRELTMLFDGAGAIGPRHWKGRIARRQANQWAVHVIEAIRAGHDAPPETSAAHVIAWHRDLEGRLLEPEVAAVELLNVLRPTVAIAVFIAFLVLALHEHPEYRETLCDDDGGDFSEMFVQEVRRFFPFFPAVAAVTRHEFQWNGYDFRQATRALLDLYGTNHDERLWDAPEAFRPERFRNRAVGPFDLIPQGGGDPHQDHRCAGEQVTIELLKLALDVLCNRIRYDVPEQDLGVDFSRLPALPHSRCIISNVRSIAPSAATIPRPFG